MFFIGAAVMACIGMETHPAKPDYFYIVFGLGWNCVALVLGFFTLTAAAWLAAAFKVRVLTEVLDKGDMFINCWVIGAFWTYITHAN